MRAKKPKKFMDRLIEEQRKQNQKIEDLIWNVNATEPTAHITQVAFADTPKEAEYAIYFMKKYEQLKEVIQNMVERLDQGSEMTLTKDSIIVLALKEAIK